MTKYQVVDLEGALLDAAVAMAEGWHITYHGFDEDGGEEIAWWGSRTENGFALYETKDDYTPSSDWMDGGHIIDRERIGLIPNMDDGNTSWLAKAAKLDAIAIGKTPLEAAMRAYVLAMLGEEVEL